MCIRDRIKIPENAGGTETGKKKEKEKISVQESWREMCIRDRPASG